MSNRWVKTLQAILLGAVLLATGRVFGGNVEKGSKFNSNARQLLSVQQMERNQGLEGFIAEYREVSTALIKTLEEAKSRFRTDRRYHSPLHSAILAVDTWQVIDADALLLSLVDYELNPSSLPLGMNVPGNYFYPAATTLVHLRVDTRKVENALMAAGNPTNLRILTWVLLERGRDIETVRAALTNISNMSHGATEKQNINRAIELLNRPSDLLPIPGRSGQSHPSSQ